MLPVWDQRWLKHISSVCGIIALASLGAPINYILTYMVSDIVNALKVRTWSVNSFGSDGRIYPNRCVSVSGDLPFVFSCIKHEISFCSHSLSCPRFHKDKNCSGIGTQVARLKTSIQCSACLKRERGGSKLSSLNKSEANFLESEVGNMADLQMPLPHNLHKKFKIGLNSVRKTACDSSVLLGSLHP